MLRVGIAACTLSGVLAWRTIGKHQRGCDGMCLLHADGDDCSDGCHMVLRDNRQDHREWWTIQPVYDICQDCYHIRIDGHAQPTGSSDDWNGRFYLSAAADGSYVDLYRAEGDAQIWYIEQPDYTDYVRLRNKLLNRCLSWDLKFSSCDGNDEWVLQGGGGDRDWPFCDSMPFSVVGYWSPIKSILRGTEESCSYKNGTSKTLVETQTDTWSKAVTRVVGASLQMKGIGGVSASVSETIAQSHSTTYSEEWSVNEEETSTWTIDNEPYDRYLWQWMYRIRDRCGYVDYTTKTEEKQFSTSRKFAPCCLPGYNLPTDWSTCYDPEDMLPGQTGWCKVQSAADGLIV